MKINQKQDGSGEIVFSNQEIEIIKKQKKLILTKEFLKHFMNLFIGLFVEYQNRFDEKTKKILTTKNFDIKTNKESE